MANKSVSGWQTAFVLVALLSLVAVIFTLQFFSTHVKYTRRRNKGVRAKLFKRLALDKGEGQKPRRHVVGFLHPYCNAGGGGERVLWQAIEHQLRQDDRIVVVVYSGDVGPENAIEGGDVRERRPEAVKRNESAPAAKATKEEILQKCNTRFGIPLHSPDLASRIHFLPLTTRYLVSDGYWKRFTLLGQAYGSARMAFEACGQLLPDTFIDTMGYAFAYPVVRMFDHRIPIGAYVHYPMISTDMLRRVKERKAGHTNDASVSASRWRSFAKLTYYRLFAWVYSCALRTADVLVANGSWTRDHLNGLTLASDRKHQASSPKFVQVIYPPCDTASLTTFDLTAREHLKIVSLAQFRPEKEHATQIRIVKEMVDRRTRAGEGTEAVQLVCMGSSRDEGDERRIEGLRKLVVELQLENHVRFVVNASYSDLLENLKSASVGLSTMVDEHFGINVVEFMAAGLITLSHASAGPLLDIAVPTSDGQPTGFHANTVADFADQLEHIARLDPQEELAIRTRARQRAVEVFSNEAFCEAWDNLLWSRLNATESKKQL